MERRRFGDVALAGIDEDLELRRHRAHYLKGPGATLLFALGIVVVLIGVAAYTGWLG